MSNIGVISGMEIYVGLFNSLRLADKHKAELENRHFVMD